MTLFSSQPGDEGLPGPARARVMAAIMTTTLMGVFDGTMINIALPSMAQEMQVPASIAVWFANGYLLAAAMTLAIFAALAARLGYRPVFLAGLTTFTLTSLGCALANKPEVLIGKRVLQGIGGAYLAAFWGSMPCSLPRAPLSARYWAVRSFTPLAGNGCLR